MEDTDWAASGLFSPSKARVAQAQARDWNYVDAWLAKKYSSHKIPSFERTDETLHALLALATVNESADEQRVAVERVEKAALQFYNRQSSDPTNDLYRTIVDNLDGAGREAHDALATVVVDLNVSAKEGFAGVASSIVRLQTEAFELGELERNTSEQHAALQRECTRVSALLGYLKGEEFQPSPDLAEQTSEWSRGSKQLRAKIGEYDERLNALRSATQASPAIGDIQKDLDKLQEQRERLAALNAEMAAFQSLPTDPGQARKVISRARDELQQLIARRDELFDGLVTNG